LNKETCQRTLPIFDGRQRYDLQLEFKRLDKVHGQQRLLRPGDCLFL